jgi:hypothetical protein
MKNYYTGKASDYIEQTVSQLVTNDDLYNECTRLVEINKTCDKLTRLKNNVVFGEIAYRFRVKKLELCQDIHSSTYASYVEPMENAMIKLLSARDYLMDYCNEKRIKTVNFYVKTA